ncbi:MAG TPA: energy transducer TonB [Thermoanaerobaculia bacterium]|nr:energy transducer TonB [Thermoanaerobaculia bacterium]
MKKAAGLLLLLAAPAVFGDELDIAKGLQNLETIHRLAGVVELRRTLPGTLPLEYPKDPWGNAYLVADAQNGYRIIGAGSDGQFQPSGDTQSTQFTRTDRDVVFENGRLIRSNRNWLYARVTENGPSAIALAALQQAEVEFAMMRVPMMQALTGAKATEMSMALIAQYVEQNKAAPAPELSLDAWGTPLRITVAPDGKYRIVSAGSDKVFDESSWSRAAKADLAEDIVYENGKLIRNVRGEDVLQNATLRAAAVPQPPDTTLLGTGPWLRVEEGITPPVPEKRVDPIYPEEYRRAKVAGLVVLEVAVSQAGTVENVGVVKSLAPGLDMSAVNAVRQWTFKPALRDGKPVPVLYNMTINFSLK